MGAAAIKFPCLPDPDLDPIGFVCDFERHGGNPKAAECAALCLELIIADELWRAPTAVARSGYRLFSNWVHEVLRWPSEGGWTAVNAVLKARYPDSAELHRKFARAYQSAGTHGGDRKSDGFKGDDITLEKKPSRGSTSVVTIMKRLRQERPDLAVEVEEGRLSANAAAIEAGFKRDPSSDDAIFDRLLALWREASPLVRERFAKIAVEG